MTARQGRQDSLVSLRGWLLTPGLRVSFQIDPTPHEPSVSETETWEIGPQASRPVGGGWGEGGGGDKATLWLGL